MPVVVAAETVKTVDNLEPNPFKELPEWVIKLLKKVEESPQNLELDANTAVTLFSKHEQLMWWHDCYRCVILPRIKKAEQKQVQKEYAELSLLLQHFFKFYHPSPQLQEFYRAEYTKVTAQARTDSIALPHYLLSVREFRTKTFVEINWYRLLLLRVSQVSVAATALFVVHFLEEFNRLYSHAALGFGVLSFAYYAPRVLFNLVLVCKHVFYERGMPAEQKSIPKKDRLSMQLRRRGFQLINDTMWLLDGLAVFLLQLFCTSAVANPLSAILVGALYFGDVLNAWYELHKEKKMVRILLNEAGPHLELMQEYCRMRLAKKKFDLNITIVFAIAKIPLLVMGIVVFVMGLSILSNPIVLGVFLAAAIVVLATHIFQKVYAKNYAIKPCEPVEEQSGEDNPLTASKLSLASTVEVPKPLESSGSSSSLNSRVSSQGVNCSPVALFGGSGSPRSDESEVDKFVPAAAGF